jgi:histidinol dehydrogenase
MKKQKVEGLKFIKVMKETEKTMRKKLKTAPKEVKPVLLQEINRITSFLKENKKNTLKNEKENRRLCEREYFAIQHVKMF